MTQEESAGASDARPAPDGPPAHPAWRIVQHNTDRREIYLLSTGADSTPLAYGPLTEQDFLRHWYGSSPERGRRAGFEQAQLARRLAERADQFHDLDDFFRAFYPPDVARWASEVPARMVTPQRRVVEGYPVAEVAQRLGVDASLLDAVAYEEGGGGGLDSAGSPWYYPELGEDNWALSSDAGVHAVNPASLRFKGWLSFHS